MVSTREIAHTDWVKKFIAKDSLNPGVLYLIHDLPHQDQPNPDSALYFNGITTLLIIENWKVVVFFSCNEKKTKNFTKERIRNL